MAGDDQLPQGNHTESKNARDEDSPLEPAFRVHDRRFWVTDNADGQSQEQEPAPSAPSYVVQLETRLEEKDKQLREYIAAYKTEVGQKLEETKARLERDAQKRIDQLRGELALPMLDVLSALDRSIQAAGASGDMAQLLEGIKNVHLLMVQQLRELGLVRIPTVGHPFNPSFHEALALLPVSDPSQDNLIQAEFAPGFTLSDRVVRAAQVQVGKHK
jgi:molecular chaperone GrpE